MLGCTVEELGERMSPAEFCQWGVMLEEEPMGASAAWVMWSRLMAGLANGPMVRTDKRAWDARDFHPEFWPAPPPPAEPLKRGAVAAALKRFIASKRQAGDAR